MTLKATNKMRKAARDKLQSMGYELPSRADLTAVLDAALAEMPEQSKLDANALIADIDKTYDPDKKPVGAFDRGILSATITCRRIIKRMGE